MSLLHVDHEATFLAFSIRVCDRIRNWQSVLQHRNIHLQLQHVSLQTSPPASSVMTTAVLVLVSANSPMRSSRLASSGTAFQRCRSSEGTQTWESSSSKSVSPSFLDQSLKSRTCEVKFSSVCAWLVGLLQPWCTWRVGLLQPWLSDQKQNTNNSLVSQSAGNPWANQSTSQTQSYMGNHCHHWSLWKKSGLHLTPACHWTCLAQLKCKTTKDFQPEVMTFVLTVKGLSQAKF